MIHLCVGHIKLLEQPMKVLESVGKEDQMLLLALGLGSSQSRLPSSR